MFADQRLPERFWAKVQRVESGCWVWVGAISAKGYGRFGLHGRNRLAYGVAFEALVGPIPEGLQLDHLCRNRACVNPSHLDVVTPAENTRRSPLLGLGNLRKTHCPQGHPYSGANLIITRNGWRFCRTCRNAHMRSWKQRKREAA